MEDRQRIYAVMAVAAVAAILLSCIVGAAGGAIAGWIVGQEQGQAAAERVLARERVLDAEQVPVPLPEEVLPLPEEVMPMPGRVGALIIRVVPGSPAEEAELRAGDLIVAVDGTPVDANHDLGEIVAQYEPGDRVTLTVRRASGRVTVPLVLGDEEGRPYIGIRYRTLAGIDLELPTD